MTDLKPRIEEAGAAGKLSAASCENILKLLETSRAPLVQASIRELVEGACWDEMNDRFFRTLSFGTGGLRGRTIGKIVTEVERGTVTDLGRPEHPCVGTNAMNGYNISRAVQGLVAYLKTWRRNDGKPGRAKLVIAYDSRHFSRDFAQLAARVATDLGCDAALFDAPRSTPELSFAVRYLRADGGVVITASHNPPHDNGFKCYGPDGAQVVEPHAGGIIAEVNAIASDEFAPVPEGERGELEPLGTAIDAAYMDRLETLVLDRNALSAGRELRLVYTSLHGTGGVLIRPVLERLGFSFSTVSAQDAFDGRFPTVKSPNPENAEALALAVQQAEAERADLVLATDPDCDRMGLAARDGSGAMRLLTGNQIGSLMGWYRIVKMKELGLITPETASRCVLIKTFVTTDLQKTIAERNGMRCVETLTGFKYLGAKLEKYERQLPPAARENYPALPEEETRKLRLEHSTFFVFGGEESYGYSGADFVRDKDGNAAVVMLAEVAAAARAQGLTLHGLMDRIYAEYGYYAEKNGSLMFEGADGAAKIQALAASYADSPFSEMLGVAVEGIRNFAEETFYDVEGDPIPAEKMMIFALADGFRVAVRPSGTEPKIKFYLFGCQVPAAGTKLADGELERAKAGVGTRLDALWDWIQDDVKRRFDAPAS
jgi:phosphoglucomutase